MSMFRRKPQSPERTRLFEDLTPQQQQEAQQRLTEFLARHPRRESWLYPILIGQARRLALNPPTSAWGRSMHAKRGGYAVQRLHQVRGFDAAGNARRCRSGYIRAFKQARSAGFARSAVHLEAI